MSVRKKHALQFLGQLEMREAQLLSWGIVDGFFTDDEIDDLAEQFLQQTPDSGFDDSDELLPVLVQGLYVSARLEGRKSTSSPIAEKIDLLFQEDELPRGEHPNEKWRSMMQQIAKLHHSDTKQPSWVLLLSNYVGARQGSGPTVHAVDITQIVPYLDKDKTGTYPLPTITGKNSNTKRAIHEGYKTVQKALEKDITLRQTELLQWYRQYKDWSGNSPKNEIIDQLRDFITKSKQIGMTGQFNVTPLRKLLTEFKKLSIKKQIDLVTRLEEESTKDEASLEVVLRNIGRIDDKVIETAKKVMEQSNAFIAHVKTRMDNYLKVQGDGGVETAHEELKLEIKNIGDNLKDYQELL